MRVLQLIDSLDPGGAERCAVSLANGLVQEIERSFIAVTRKEGILKKQLNEEVSYSFLRKKNAFDLGALKRLKTLVKEQKINIIHAHGTSFFFATLLKARYSKVEIIWHNHSGASPRWTGFRLKSIQWASCYFKAIVNVNQEQLIWTKKVLKTKRSVYVANFVGADKNINQTMKLSGDPDHRLIVLANLRAPKGHHFLLETFNEIHKKCPKATLHLVGKDYEDDYSASLKSYIKTQGLENCVLIHGLQEDPKAFLNACKIGVLSSSSEGLPMALLEYGIAKLAVVTTAVGHCPEVVGSYGKVVPYGKTEAFAMAMVNYLEDGSQREKDALQYAKHIKKTYSLGAVLHKIIDLYKAT